MAIRAPYPLSRNARSGSGDNTRQVQDADTGERPVGGEQRLWRALTDLDDFNQGLLVDSSCLWVFIPFGVGPDRARARSCSA